MNFTKVLIPIDDSNSTVIPITLTPDTPSRDPDPADTDTFPEIAAKVSATPAEVEGFTLSRYSHPAVPLNVIIPDDDLPLVKTWFGGAASDRIVPSDTLVKRMTDAAIGSLRSYFERAQLNNLLTSPFMIAHALRRADGSHCAVSPFTRKLIDTRAPLLVIHEAEIGSSSLRTVTEILNSPVALSLDISPFDIPAGLLPAVTHLDIIISRPVALLDGSEKVSSVRTSSIMGENHKVWQYDRMPEDIVLSELARSDDFRVIASIPVADAMKGVTGRTLPQQGYRLSDWDSLPKPGGAFSPDNPDNPAQNHTHVCVATGFLDLGSPYEYKKVRAVTAHGIFPRARNGKGEEIEMELLGSHHRDEWRTVARSRGPHLRLLRAAAFRWWQVRVTLPRHATLDALAFSISPVKAT